MSPPNPRAMSMGQVILESYRAKRDRPIGLLDRLRDTGPLDEPRAKRFARYHAEFEAALKHGDELAAAVADTQIDKVLAESRAARAQAVSNVGHSGAEPTAPVSFDGGVRGRRPVAPTPGLRRPESSRELFARAMRASQAERAERAP